MLRLEGYNREIAPHDSAGRYHFGLDVNLLFLPEFYLAAASRGSATTRRFGVGFGARSRSS